MLHCISYSHMSPFNWKVICSEQEYAERTEIPINYGTGRSSTAFYVFKRCLSVRHVSLLCTYNCHSCLYLLPSFDNLCDYSCASMNLNTPLQGAHIQDPFGLTLANELWGVEYPPGTKLSRLSYALVRQVLTPDLLRKDDRLDSYILALEDKLCVFNPSWHIIRNFQHLVDLVQLLKDTWGMKRESLLPHLAAFQPKVTAPNFAISLRLDISTCDSPLTSAFRTRSCTLR